MEFIRSLINSRFSRSIIFVTSKRGTSPRLVAPHERRMRLVIIFALSNRWQTTTIPLAKIFAISIQTCSTLTKHNGKISSSPKIRNDTKFFPPQHLFISLMTPFICVILFVSNFFFSTYAKIFRKSPF